MAKAGLAKLNMNLAANSMKKAAASTLSNTQRSVGVSYGIKAQRSNQSIFNVKLANSNNIQETRHDLLRQTKIYNNIPMPKTDEPKMSFMDKLMMYSMIASTAAEFGRGIYDTVKDLKGKGNDTSVVDKKEESNSLKDITKESNKVNSDINKFGKNYKELANDDVKVINSSLEKFKSNENTQKYLSNLNTESLNNNDLGLSENSTLDDISKAGESITSDIGEVQGFINNVNTVIQTLTTDIGSLEGQIRGLEAKQNKTEAENEQLSKLKNQKKDLEDLQKELKKTVLDQANSLEKELEGESEKLTELANTKKNVMDKMYKQAQTDEKNITANNKKMTELAQKIEKEKDDGKKQKLIAEYNKLAGLNKTISDAISTAGTIKSSANVEFKLSVIPMVQQYPTTGSAQSSTQVKPQTEGAGGITQSVNNNVTGTLNKAEIATLMNPNGVVHHQVSGLNFTIKNIGNNQFQISNTSASGQADYNATGLQGVISYINAFASQHIQNIAMRPELD